MIVGNGRPLRFLAMVSGGWVALRVALLWQATGSLPDAVREILPLPEPALAAAVPVPPVDSTPPTASPRSWAGKAARVGVGLAATPAAPPAMSPDAVRVQLALLAMTRVAVTPTDDDSRATPARGPLATPSQALSPLVRPTHPSRLSVSSWMIVRGGTGIGATALSPQLGGTQGGARLDYALFRGVAATARIAAPAAGAGREMSLGLAWRPSGVPLRFVAEQRIALDGGRSGPALGVSGGVSQVKLPAGFRLEGYGQAGAILRDGVEKYVDGSVRATQPVTSLGGIALDVGGGAWGGAQRGVARLDVGPTVGARVPIAGQNVRVAVDWRQRIAGRARPGSGPALTLGTDF